MRNIVSISRLVLMAVTAGHVWKFQFFLNHELILTVIINLRLMLFNKVTNSAKLSSHKNLTVAQPRKKLTRSSITLFTSVCQSFLSVMMITFNEITEQRLFKIFDNKIIHNLKIVRCLGTHCKFCKNKINSSLWTYVNISDSKTPKFNLRVYGETTRILKKIHFLEWHSSVMAYSQAPCVLCFQSSMILVPYFV